MQKRQYYEDPQALRVYPIYYKDIKKHNRVTKRTSNPKEEKVSYVKLERYTQISF